MSTPITPRRELGRTGFVATNVGIGDLADATLGLDECVRIARRALDAGLNVIDTAPAYENGLSEQIVGAAVRDRRDRVFVIDKIDDLDAPVTPQIDKSLATLGLAHTDLFVFHNLSSVEKWGRIAAPGGAMEELAACMGAGKTRFRGISSHHPDVLIAAIPSGLCDVVMFPLGPHIDARYRDEVLPLAKKHGVGVVSFKTFGAGMLLGDTAGYGKPIEGPGGKPRLGVEECVRYTLGLDPDVALLGMSSDAEQDAALDAVREYAPLNEDAREDVVKRAAKAVEGTGPVWWNPSRR